jgi:hypothetical protein
MRPVVVAQCGLESVLEVAPAHSSDLSRVRADRLTRTREIPAGIQEFEDANASPIALAQRSKAL